MADLNALKAGLESVKALVDREKHDGTVSEQERTQALKAELEQVERLNRVFTKVNAAITKAASDLDTMAVGAANANQLLDKWVKILSQTEHNYRLLSSRHWHGASKDQLIIAEKEAEKLRRLEMARQEQERRRRQEELRLQKEKELAEKRKAQLDLQQRRIYGRTMASSTTSVRPASRTVPQLAPRAPRPAPRPMRSTPRPNTSLESAVVKTPVAQSGPASSTGPSVTAGVSRIRRPPPSNSSSATRATRVPRR